MLCVWLASIEVDAQARCSRVDRITRESAGYIFNTSYTGSRRTL